MSLPTEKISELKQIIHSQLSQVNLNMQWHVVHMQTNQYSTCTDIGIIADRAFAINDGASSTNVLTTVLAKSLFQLDSAL